MKSFFLIPLLFLSACSSTPKLTLQPRPPSTALPADTVRYPETVRAYHFGRYVDPNDDLVMHEQHVVYRVEENTRWDLRPRRAATMGSPLSCTSNAVPRDAAFSPSPVNDEILAEVNSQRLATTQVMAQSRALSAMLTQFAFALHQTQTNLQQTADLRASVAQMKQRLDALETAPPPDSNFSTTNTVPDPLAP